LVVFSSNQSDLFSKSSSGSPQDHLMTRKILIFRSILENLQKLKKKDKIFKVYNAYERNDIYYVPKCGNEDCQMPIVEIGFFGGKDKDFDKKPKILITAGMDGTEETAIAAAMNLIVFLGNFNYFCLTLKIGIVC
jgi:hypothetical protein